MVTTFSGQLFLHFFVGFALSLLVALPWLKAGKRRYIFHFGGNHALTLGFKNLWFLWYIVALGIEVGTSMLTHKIYVEWALSPFQAMAFTCGAFILDRLAMMWEPTNFYGSSSNFADLPSVIDIAPQKQIPSGNPDPPEAGFASSPSWIRTILHRTKKNIASAPQVVIEKINESRDTHREESKIRKQAEKAKGQDEAQERINKFRDLVKGK